MRRAAARPRRAVAAIRHAVFRGTQLTLLGALLSVSVGGACRRDAGSAAPATGASATPAKPSSAACLAGATGATGTLRWFEDRYDDAAACAATLGRPLVVDLWAPWCHTCLSMQETVLPDPALAPLADRFVFVALDTDRPENAAAVAKLPPSAWPTFYVVDAAGAIHGRFVGAATVQQFRALLEGAASAHAAPLPAGSADAHLLDADRAVAAGDLAAAERGYAAALAAAPATWPRRADVLVNQIQARRKLRDDAGCLALAEAELDRLAASSSRTDFLVYALGCATALAATDAPRVAAFRARATASLQALVDDLAAPLSVDDRSDALLNLREAHLALGRAEDARLTAQRQRALLDDAATRAASPRTAMTYNWPRAEVYTFLGVPLELVPALEASAQALPDEYDPPHRLAWILWKAGQPDAARPWAERALARSYGPRKARIEQLLRDLAAPPPATP